MVVIPGHLWGRTNLGGEGAAETTPPIEPKSVRKRKPSAKSSSKNGNIVPFLHTPPPNEEETTFEENPSCTEQHTSESIKFEIPLEASDPEKLGHINFYIQQDLSKKEIDYHAVVDYGKVKLCISFIGNAKKQINPDSINIDSIHSYAEKHKTLIGISDIFLESKKNVGNCNPIIEEFIDNIEFRIPFADEKWDSQEYVLHNLQKIAKPGSLKSQKIMSMIDFKHNEFIFKIKSSSLKIYISSKLEKDHKTISDIKLINKYHRHGGEKIICILDNRHSPEQTESQILASLLEDVHTSDDLKEKVLNILMDFIKYPRKQVHENHFEHEEDETKDASKSTVKIEEIVPDAQKPHRNRISLSHPQSDEAIVSPPQSEHKELQMTASKRARSTKIKKTTTKHRLFKIIKYLQPTIKQIFYRYFHEPPYRKIRQSDIEFILYIYAHLPRFVRRIVRPSIRPFVKDYIKPSIRDAKRVMKLQSRYLKIAHNKENLSRIQALKQRSRKEAVKRRSEFDKHSTDKVERLDKSDEIGQE